MMIMESDMKDLKFITAWYQQHFGFWKISVLDVISAII